MVLMKIVISVVFKEFACPNLDPLSAGYISRNCNMIAVIIILIITILFLTYYYIYVILLSER